MRAGVARPGLQEVYPLWKRDVMHAGPMYTLPVICGHVAEEEGHLRGPRCRPGSRDRHGGREYHGRTMKRPENRALIPRMLPRARGPPEGEYQGASEPAGAR